LSGSDETLPDVAMIGYTRIAVLLVQEITARFFNVISLFSLFIRSSPSR